MDFIITSPLIPTIIFIFKRFSILMLLEISFAFVFDFSNLLYLKDFKNFRSPYKNLLQIYECISIFCKVLLQIFISTNKSYQISKESINSIF